MDEYDIFGELVARKVRNLEDSFARSTVQVIDYQEGKTRRFPAKNNSYTKKR